MRIYLRNCFVGLFSWDFDRQQLWATAEPPHIVVGNPRSLQKLVDNGRLRLNSVNFIVIDEVDACLLKTETKKVI